MAKLICRATTPRLVWGGATYAGGCAVTLLQVAGSEGGEEGITAAFLPEVGARADSRLLGPRSQGTSRSARIRRSSCAAGQIVYTDAIAVAGLDAAADPAHVRGRRRMRRGGCLGPGGDNSLTVLGFPFHIVAAGPLGVSL